MTTWSGSRQALLPLLNKWNREELPETHCAGGSVAREEVYERGMNRVV